MNANTWGNVAVIGVAVAAAVIYRAYGRRRAVVAPVTTDPNVGMVEAAAEAVQMAAKRGVALDYSPESVKLVEPILASIHEQHVKGQLSEPDLHLNAMVFGAYIGEVLRRKYGGFWAVDHPQIGARTFPIHWKENDSFPVGWCGKRILNGDEDNVWFKFRVLTSESFKPGAGHIIQPNQDGKIEI